MWLDSGALRRYKKKHSWRWMLTRIQCGWPRWHQDRPAWQQGGAKIPFCCHTLGGTPIHLCTGGDWYSPKCESVTFSDTIWPLSLSSNFGTQIKGHTEKLSYQSSSPCCADYQRFIIILKFCKFVTEMNEKKEKTIIFSRKFLITALVFFLV